MVREASETDGGNARLGPARVSTPELLNMDVVGCQDGVRHVQLLGRLGDAVARAVPSGRLDSTADGSADSKARITHGSAAMQRSTTQEGSTGWRLKSRFTSGLPGLSAVRARCQWSVWAGGDKEWDAVVEAFETQDAGTWHGRHGEC